MTTVAEIQSAIEQLPPQDFRLLQAWMAKLAAAMSGRMWTPEELGEGAKRMLAETDSERAQVLKEELIRGFYGDANA